MSEMIWLNGEIRPMGETLIAVEDRGFQFADGIYEVVRLYGGRPFTLREHLERLERSAAAIGLAMPLDRESLDREIRGFVQKSGIGDGMVYLQLTRGAAPRNHVFPACRPTLLFYVRELPPVAAAGTAAGARLLSVPDERWKKCWIKSIALLANVLAKNTAIAAGADEAVFVEEALVSECSASNLFVVSGGTLLTAPVGPKVLPGITRLVLLGLARQTGITVQERPIAEAEALAADEIFITSTTREVSWVMQWNGRAVGRGECGPLSLQLHRLLQQKVKQETA